jgi:uncharacterized protein (DUF362 family)
MEKNDILIIQGLDYKCMTKTLLEEAGLDRLIGSKDARIGLKPNLVTPSPASQGATTHPEILEGAIEFLQERGFRNIQVMESSWCGADTAEALRVCGYRGILDKYQVPFLDVKKEKAKEYDCAGMKLCICEAAVNVDFMINMPVLKGHSQTLITCALKNYKGLIPDREKRHFHAMGLHRPIAHLNTRVRTDFILVDNICGDLDFEEGGNPVEMNRILGFRDPVLCDAFVCETIGYRPEEVPYIRMAAQLGAGDPDTGKAVIRQLDGRTAGKIRKRGSGRVQKLAKYAAPEDACSACYGSLIYALERLKNRGLLSERLPRVAVGQGYRGKSGKIGVGNCTRCFEKNLKGCPPRAADIVEFLEKEWKE